MRDIKFATLETITKIAGLNDIETMKQLLMRLASDLSSSMVVIGLETPAPAGVIPEYNAETDGDYSAWLASNNID